MPHPKASAAPPVPSNTAPLPPDESFAPPPGGFDEAPSNPQDPGYDDGLMLPPPPASARGKKSGKHGKKAREPEPDPPAPIEEEGLFVAEPEQQEEEVVEEEEQQAEEQEQEQEEEHVLVDEPEAPARPVKPDEDQASAGSDGRDSEPPDVQVEVAQLHDMVNKCLKTALKGCPCTVLQDGERVSSKYYVDEALERVKIVPQKKGGPSEIVVPISGIQDIFCVPEDGEAAFPSEAISLLAAEEKELLLMVVYQGLKGDYGKFCLLMDNTDGRDGFMEAMRVLCVASRFNAEQSSSSSRPSVPSAGTSGASAGTGARRAGGASGSKDGLAIPRQQVSVRFFMRSIGIKALQPSTLEQGPSCPLPPLIKDGVTSYISAYGYRPRDEMTWEMISPDSSLSMRPTLSIRVRQHFEAAKHTWYIVETTLRMEKVGNVPRLDWLAPRRLVHLRVHLHDTIKDILGESYHRHFAGASFAHRLGLPGTTAQLHRWVNALAEIINDRRVPPLVAATALNFLEAPNPAIGAASNGAADDLAPFQAAMRR